MIDLNKQFDEFYSRLDYFPLSATAISLYFSILQIVKKRNWEENLKIANRARSELVQNRIYYL